MTKIHKCYLWKVMMTIPFVVTKLFHKINRAATFIKTRRQSKIGIDVDCIVQPYILSDTKLSGDYYSSFSFNQFMICFYEHIAQP